MCNVLKTPEEQYRPSPKIYNVFLAKEEIEVKLVASKGKWSGKER